MKKIVLLILFIIPVSIFAQDATIEQRFLGGTSLEMVMVRELARADTREQKLLALETIEDLINSGRVNPDDIVINNVLTNLAGEGTFVLVREGGRKVNDFPEVRRDAAKLLGELGGEKSKVTLIDLTLREKEPMVLAQTVFALGEIGLNDSNEALIAIARVLDDNTKRRNPDQNLAIASLIAIRKVVETNNGYPAEPSPDLLWSAILGVETGNYSANVRNFAGELRKSLAQY